VANDLSHLRITDYYQAEDIPQPSLDMGCTLPPFINDPVTIDPLPHVDIVCRTVYPPALALPEIVMPPCMDGITITAADFSVTVEDSTTHAPAGTGTAAINVTTTNCNTTIGGTLNLSLDIGSAGGVGCVQPGGGIIVIKDEDGVCTSVTGCDKDVKFDTINANELIVTCSATGASDAAVMVTSDGIFAYGAGNQTAIGVTGSKTGVFVSNDITGNTGTWIEQKSITMADDVTSTVAGLYLSDLAINLVTTGIDFDVRDSSVVILNVGGASGQVTIDPSLIDDTSKNMYIREMTVCVDGEIKSMLILASDPY